MQYQKEIKAYAGTGNNIFVGLAIHADSSGNDRQLLFEVKIVWHKELANSSFRYGYGGKFLSSYDSFIETAQIKKFEKQASAIVDFQGENDARKHSRKPYNKSFDSGGVFYLAARKLFFDQITKYPDGKFDIFLAGLGERQPESVVAAAVHEKRLTGDKSHLTVDSALE